MLLTRASLSGEFAHVAVSSAERRTVVKFRVERDVLSEAVAWVVRGLSNRPPVPVLAGVYTFPGECGTFV